MALATIEDALKYNPRMPLASSRDRAWGDCLTVDAHGNNPNFLVDAPPLDHHFVTCVCAGSGRLQQVRSGRTYSAVIHANEVTILPSGQAALWHGHTPRHVRFRIAERLLALAWQEVGEHPTMPVELLPVFVQQDQFLGTLARLFLDELKKPAHPAQQLVAEAATCMVTAHLVRRHCAFTSKPSPQRLRLDQGTVKRIEEYVEDHMGAALTLKALAQLSGLSVFYFCRVFHNAIGMTPMRYVERRRLLRAESLLRSGNRNLQNVAACVGYKDQNQFSRRFKAHLHCTPSEFVGQITSASSTAAHNG